MECYSCRFPGYKEGNNKKGTPRTFVIHVYLLQALGNAKCTCKAFALRSYVYRIAIGIEARKVYGEFKQVKIVKFNSLSVFYCYMIQMTINKRKSKYSQPQKVVRGRYNPNGNKNSTK